MRANLLIALLCMTPLAAAQQPKADFFNAWNHQAFSPPAVADAENLAAFADVISTENNPRLIQFSLKW